MRLSRLPGYLVISDSCKSQERTDSGLAIELQNFATQKRRQKASITNNQTRPDFAYAVDACRIGNGGIQGQEDSPGLQRNICPCMHQSTQYWSGRTGDVSCSSVRASATGWGWGRSVLLGRGYNLVWSVRMINKQEANWLVNRGFTTHYFFGSDPFGQGTTGCCSLRRLPLNGVSRFTTLAGGWLGTGCLVRG